MMHGAGSAPPTALSVVIASYNSATTIGSCLRSLERQDTTEPYEILVVDSSTDGTASLVARDFSRVRLFTSAARRFPGDARNIGVTHATGAIIAFTDADCVVGPTWVRHILDAHGRTPHPIIGGAVENGNPNSYVGWASYFTEFTAWMPHGTPREMIEIPTSCLTLKRWAFDKYGPFLAATYCSDTAFSWKMGKKGYRPLFLPDLRVSHINISDLMSFLRRKAFHGKSFARVRMAEQQFSRSRQYAYILLAPLLPPLLFGRILRRVARHRAYVKQFAVASPLVFCGLIAWAWGELRGYLSSPYVAPSGDHD